MKLATYPRYNDIFPSEATPELSQILSELPSKSLLHVLSTLNQKIYAAPYNVEIQKKILGDIWGDMNDQEGKIIVDSFNLFFEYQSKIGRLPIVFNSIVLLNIIQQVLINPNNLPDIDGKNKGELSLFTKKYLKAILIGNSMHDDKIKNIISLSKKKSLHIISLAIGAAQHEFTEPKDLIYIITLAGELSVFLQNKPEITPYLSEFLKTRKLKHISEYFTHLISIFARPLTGNIYSIIVKDPNYFNLFNELSIDISQANIAPIGGVFDPDYKSLRNKPLLKLTNEKYTISYFNFLLDKFYQGLIFNIYYQTSLKNDKTKYKSFADFLSALGKDFAETQFFHKFLPDCFVKGKDSVLVPGGMYPEIEYSDFYVRKNKSIYLFEFKNYLINSNVKHSNDYDKIRNTIYSKLVEDKSDKKSKKGVNQLIDKIKDVDSGGYHFDDLKTKGERFKIYPILVYSDNFFSVDGVQQIVSEYFMQNLPYSIQKRQSVKDIVIIHLYDIFILSFVARKRNISFESMLGIYYRKVKKIKRNKIRSAQDAFDKQPNFHFSISSYLTPPDISTILNYFQFPQDVK